MIFFAIKEGPIYTTSTVMELLIVVLQKFYNLCPIYGVLKLLARVGHCLIWGSVHHTNKHYLYYYILPFIPLDTILMIKFFFNIYKIKSIHSNITYITG